MYELTFRDSKLFSHSKLIKIFAYFPPPPVMVMLLGGQPQGN